MPYAERDGLRLYYERDGAGTPELLFVPGWCCDHTFYAPQFEHFKHTHAVTALALRGCGPSDSPPDGYDIPSLAEDVAWFCAEVGVERPVVIGHSLGGMVALELAARHVAGMRRRRRRPRPGLPHRSRESHLFAFSGADGGPGGRGRAARVGRGRCRADGERGTPAEDRRDDVLRSAAGRSCGHRACRCSSCSRPPGGSNDPSRLQPLKPDAWFGMTVGAGHFHQLEVPEQVNAVIERFLEIAI